MDYIILFTTNENTKRMRVVFDLLVYFTKSLRYPYFKFPAAPSGLTSDVGSINNFLPPRSVYLGKCIHAWRLFRQGIYLPYFRLKLVSHITK